MRMDWTWWSNWLDPSRHATSSQTWALTAAAALGVVILVVALIRADKSVANAVLAVITLLSLGLVGLSLTGGAAGPGRGRSAEARPGTASLPALACIDDLAGDEVLAACERTLFSSPETIAAAVTYTSSRLEQLAALGDVAHDGQAAADLDRIRRSVQRDRFGLVAYVLTAQHGCRPDACSQFGALGDSSRIAANMENHAYEAAVARFASNWNLPPLPATSAALVTPRENSPPETAAPVAPTGRPNSIDYPTSSSIPPVNIMTPEPPTASAKPAAAAAPKPPATAASAPSASPKASPKAGPAAPTNAQASAKKPPNPQAAAKKPPEAKPASPVQLAPAEANPDN